MSVEPLIVNNSEDYRVTIDVFEGPLDLLLYLIKKEELNIYDIPIAHITESYLEYLRMMKSLNIEIASEFLVMAATLIRIKVRMLLPAQTAEEDEDEEDPRAQLIQQLLEYKRFKEVAEELRIIEEQRLQEFQRPSIIEKEKRVEYLFEVNLFELLEAFNSLLEKKKEEFVEIEGESYTVEEKMTEIRKIFDKQDMMNFLDLFYRARSRLEAITYFLALLQLVRDGFLRVYQNKEFEAIMLYKLK